MCREEHKSYLNMFIILCQTHQHQNNITSLNVNEMLIAIAEKSIPRNASITITRLRIYAQINYY